MSTVGVIGASGAVGAGVARALARIGTDLRLGTRVPRRVRGLVDELDRLGEPDIEVRTVDLDDEISFFSFLDGLDAVVCCAAPSSRWSGPTARKALTAGVPLVDPAGGDLLRTLDKPDDLRRGSGHSAVVVDAGMQPGLTGLIMHTLLARAPSVPRSVGLWHGGLGPLPEGSARDLLLDTGTGGATPHTRRLAYRVVPFLGGTHQLPSDVPPTASVTPVLTEEINRICSAYGVPDAVEYQIINGEHVAEVARYYAASPVRLGDEERLEEAVRRLRDAARVDCTGCRPTYTLHGWAGDDELVVTTDAPFTLTAEITALAALCVIEGRVDSTVLPLDEAVDPTWVLSRLGTLPGVTVTDNSWLETGEDTPDGTNCDMEEEEIL